MKVAVIHNKDRSGVISQFGIQNRENYNPKTVEAVAAALEKNGHNVRVIDGNMHVIDKLRDFMPRVMSGERIGMVFNMAYGIQGESRYTHLPAMLEMLGVPYVGSGPTGHALALDKVITKVLLQRYDLPTPKYWVFSSSEEVPSYLNYPLIVKPKNEAVSYGLKVVNSLDELKEAIEYIISSYQQQALVEEFIQGREFAVGLLGNVDPEVFPVVEFDFQGDPMGIQTAEQKLKCPVEKICPAVISQELSEKLKSISKKAFRTLGLHDFARVDFRVDNRENIYILEVNSMASLGPRGSYVSAAKVAGYSFQGLVNRMLDVAVVRYFGQESIAPKASLLAEGLAKKKTSPLHIRVRGYLRSHAAEIETMAKELVEMNSHVKNIEGVNSLGNWVTKKLSQLGFHRQVIPQVEIGNILYFANHTSSENDVLLLGHLDTPYKYEESIAYRDAGNKIFGPGIAENKGGLTVMLAALQSLRFSRVLKNIRVGILLTTDDWLQGRFSRKHVEAAAEQSQYILGLKHGGKNSTLVTSRSGSAYYQVEFMRLKQYSDEETPRIITELCRKIISWQKLSRKEEGTLVWITSIKANSIFGRMPNHATASLSVRFRNRQQGLELDNKIRKISDRQSDKEILLQVSGGIRRPPLIYNENTANLWEKVKKAADKLEILINQEHRWTSADTCFVPEGKGVLDGLGPVGDKTNSPDEYILKSSLWDRAALLAVLIYECRKKKG